jgi:hypothetical protein
VVGPIGLAECLRVVLVERWKAFLNSATQVIVVEPSCSNNWESKAASMTRIIVINVEDLAVGPLFRVFGIDDGFDRSSAVLALVACPGSNCSPDSQRKSASAG